MDITIPKKEVELIIPSTGVTVTDAELAITLEPSHEFQVTLERDRPDFCIIVGEIDLTIYGMSLIDWFNKNFAELDLRIIQIVDEHNALVQVTLELKAFVEDPLTGNQALADLLLQLTTEVHNHFDDQYAHAELFLHLQSQITANHGLIKANADNILTLETTVIRHDGDITALARTINELSADITSIENGHSSLAHAISLLEVKVNDHYGELSAQAIRLDQLEVYIDNTITPMLDAHALGIEELKVRVTKNAEGLTSLASWTLELTAEVGVEFFPWLAWEFDVDLEDWQAYGSSSLTHGENSMNIHGSGGAWVSFSQHFSGSEYPLISMLWKREGITSGWNGAIWFQCEELSGWIRAKTFVDLGDTVDYTHQLVDLTGTDWDGRTIKAIAITFSSDPAALYLIDSIGIGRRSATGSYGSIKKVTESFVGEHFVKVGDFNTYKAQVAGNFGQINTELSIIGNDVDGLTARWMIELDMDGRLSGLYMQGTNDRTDLKFVVDKFTMYLPNKGDIKVFEAGTFDGQPALFMAGAIIKDVIRSENFRWGTGGQWKGWKLDPNGTLYAAGIQIKDSAGREILSSGSGVNWDPLFNDGDFALKVNEHLSPAAISQFFEDGSINPDQFGTYMESVGIQSAWIGEAVIGTAHIKNLNVDTNKLSSNSITDIHITKGRQLEPNQDDWIVYTLFPLSSYLIPGGQTTPFIQCLIQITMAAEFHYSDGDSTDLFFDLHLKRHDFNSDWTNHSTTLLTTYRIPVELIYDMGNGGLGSNATSRPNKVSYSFTFIDGAFNYLPKGNKDYAVHVNFSDGIDFEIFSVDIICMELKR